MSARKPVPPRCCGTCRDYRPSSGWTGGRCVAYEGADVQADWGSTATCYTLGTDRRPQARGAKVQAAEQAVIRACRRSQRLVCKAGCDCICCRALARLDRVIRGSK